MNDIIMQVLGLLHCFLLPANITEVDRDELLTATKYKVQQVNSF